MFSKMHSRANNLTKPALEDVLNNETSYPYSLDDFATFLDQTYCLENLEFWIAVKRYRYYASNYFHNANSSAALVMSDVTDVPNDCYFDDSSLRGDTPAQLDFLKQKLHEIITTFIVPNSPKEINILSSTRDDLLTNVFTYNNYHPSILDPVRSQVLELMRSSIFSQFLIEAGNAELRMSSESDDHDSDHSSGASFRGITRPMSNKHRNKQTFGAGLKQKYKKLTSKINGI